MRLCVSNLSWSVVDTDLEKSFGVYGTVISVEIVTDRMSGRSCGFAVVEMSNEVEVEAVITALDNTELFGQRIAVSRIRPRSAAHQPGERLPSLDASDATSSLDWREPLDNPDDEEIEEQRFANDWACAYRKYAGGEFRDLKGRYVGVFREEVVAIGESEEELRKEFSECAIGTPEQLVVLWIDQNDVL